MTTPEIPGARSNDAASSQPQHSSPAQPNSSASTQTLPAPPRKAKKPLNVVGLISLIAAAIGFIFACMPGALIVGWVLLPIAFVLALVSLFLKGKSKWMGIAALVLSIVGTIVGFVVFTSVVQSSFDEAFSGGEVNVAAPTAEDSAQTVPAEATAAEAGSRENPHPLGSIIESDDWRVVINSVTFAATDAVMAANPFNEAPAEGSEYILVNYSTTYIGDDPAGQTNSFVSVEYVTTEGTTINSYDASAVVPDPIDNNTLYKDGTATGNTSFTVPTATAGQGVLAVRPGMFGDKIFVAVQ